MVFLKLMNENTINFIFNEIEKAQKILIISHVNPDGDTLGTMCALKLFIGKKADTLVQTSAATGIPETYKFLPEINLSKNLDNVQNIYDLVIAVDVASIDRIVQNARQIFDNAKMTINIDHHKTNNGYAKLNYVIGSASSAGEVLYNIFKEKNMVLFQASIVSKAKFLLNNTVAIALIEESDFKKFGANNEYTEGIAETLRTIKTVEVSAVLKESDNQTTKVSLRSDNIDVCEIVKKFNGGGHIHAAGCTIKKPLKIAYELLVDEIEKCLNS